ncbi:MAG: hypothetical protein HOF21_14060 [Nitrospina sp.]|jgi:hypothetical protein|nr:hypothetical protein [Nitrospina sp.]MBT5631617.1 hypothetical protein [Nitrospina sp.]
MEDIKQNQKENETQVPPKTYPKFSFEEDLKRQNIHTMLEIYGEEYMEKIESLTR